MESKDRVSGGGSSLPGSTVFLSQEEVQEFLGRVYNILKEDHLSQ